VYLIIVDTWRVFSLPKRPNVCYAQAVQVLCRYVVRVQYGVKSAFAALTPIVPAESWPPFMESNGRAKPSHANLATQRLQIRTFQNGSYRLFGMIITDQSLIESPPCVRNDFVQTQTSRFCGIVTADNYANDCKQNAD